MDENLLLIAFVIFTLLLTIVVIFLRAKTVDDIFSDGRVAPLSDIAFSSKSRDSLPAAPKNPSSSLSSLASNEPGSGRNDGAPFSLNRESINKIGKVFGAVGFIFLFAPLPELFKNIGLGLAVIGSLAARVTNVPKGTPQQKQTTATTSTVDMLRKLASKPEYQEAMRILSADIANKKLVSDPDRRKRTIDYLRSKGIPEDDAQRNVAMMAGYLLYQQKKK